MAEAPGQTPDFNLDMLTFQDIYVHFTLDEWDLLDDSEKLMYYRVMVDNFLSATSVGLELCRYQGPTQPQQAIQPRVNTAPAMTNMLRESSGPSNGRIVAGENASSEQNVSRKVPQVESLAVQSSIQNSYQCGMCDPTLKNILHLSGQQGIAPGQQPYPCKSCGRTFWVSANRLSTRPGGFLSTLPRQSGETFLNMGNDQAPSFRRYMFYSSEAFFGAENRNFSLGNPGLVQHHATENGESHRSTQCEDAFHTEQTHDGDSEYNEAFSHEGTQSQHQNMVMEEASHKCIVCGEVFSSISSLNIHQKVHTKPYTCFDCQKSFVRKCNLVQHQKYHNGAKPYKCNECGKSFDRKILFLRHMKMNSKKPFLCSKCGKTFLCKDVLAEHQKVHLEKTVFMCDECGKCFTLRIQLNVHKRMHNVARLYMCSQCGTACISSSRLTQHMEDHTTARPMGEVNVGEPTENAPTSLDL